MLVRIEPVNVKCKNNVVRRIKKRSVVYRCPFLLSFSFHLLHICSIPGHFKMLYSPSLMLLHQNVFRGTNLHFDPYLREEGSIFFFIFNNFFIGLFYALAYIAPLFKFYIIAMLH